MRATVDTTTVFKEGQLCKQWDSCCFYDHDQVVLTFRNKTTSHKMASIHSLHAHGANINSKAETPAGKEYSNQTGNVKWKIN